jgi:hypothetical protein
VVISLTAAFSLAAPQRIAAFMQTTAVEGQIGVDLGGVWLALHYVAPTFRVSLDVDPEGPPPFVVGPVPGEQRLLVGHDGGTAVITEIKDEGIAGASGIFVGDMVIRANTDEIQSPEDFTKAFDALEQKRLLLTLRRPSLAYATARLVKIHYSASHEEVDGTSVLASEIVRVTVGDQTLPFADDLEASRRTHKLFTPTPAQLESLKKNWFELPPAERDRFVGGEHRIVGADDYDLGLRQDESLRGTRFAIVSNLKGNPALGGGATIAIYGVREATADKITGSFVESTMANAPFPISIDFNGSFVMYRLGDYSNKDVEIRQAQKQASKPDQVPDEDVKLAPDVPQ